MRDIALLLGWSPERKRDHATWKLEQIARSVQLRFCTPQPWTLRQIGESVGLTESQVGALVTRGLVLLRERQTDTIMASGHLGRRLALLTPGTRLQRAVDGDWSKGGSSDG